MRRFLALLMVFLIAGCAVRSSIPQYVHGPISPSQLVREENGIRLTVDPFFDKERTGRYFDVDPFDRGIVIVFVRLENTLGADTTSYLLRKEDIKMAVGNTSVSDTRVGGDTVAGEVVTLVGAIPLMSIPLMIVGPSLITQETRIQHNFAAKELRSQMVSLGTAVEGFVYCRVTKEELGSKELVMTIPVVDVAGRSTRLYTFVLRP